MLVLMAAVMTCTIVGALTIYAATTKSNKFLLKYSWYNDVWRHITSMLNCFNTIFNIFNVLLNTIFIWVIISPVYNFFWSFLNLWYLISYGGRKRKIKLWWLYYWGYNNLHRYDSTIHISVKMLGFFWIID